MQIAEPMLSAYCIGNIGTLVISTLRLLKTEVFNIVHHYYILTHSKYTPCDVTISPFAGRKWLGTIQNRS